MVGKGSSSPYSTGGGGYEYERRVAATYLAAMVCGDAAPGVDGTVTEVKFQQRGAGHLLDDLVVVSDKDDRASRLSLQVKHGLRVGASSEFRGVIADCWRMFAGGKDTAFDRSTDRLGIVVPRITDAAGRHCLPVLDAARASGDSDAFWSGMRGGGHSKHRNEFVDSIREAIPGSAGADATDDDLWEFLRLIYIVVLDMDNPGALGWAHAEGMCRRALYEPGEGEATKLFDVLRGVAADLASMGGSIKTAALKERLSDFDLQGHARTKADEAKLAEHSREVMAGIKTTMAGKIALDRAKLVEELGKTAKTDAITVVHGEPFAGKSTLAKLFAGKVPRTGAVLFFGADHLGNGGTLKAFLHTLGVRGALEDILETCGTAPHRYVVLDGFDRLSSKPEKAQVAKDLLAAVSRYNAGSAASAAGGSMSWKTIVTTRGMHLEDVMATVVRWSSGRRPAALEVGRLDGEEIDKVRRQAPQLARIAKGRLGKLLSLPGYLDMVMEWQLISPGGAPGPIGEGWLYDQFWKEVVLRRSGFREGRGRWQTREKLLTDMAECAHRGRLPADLHALDPDAVDGLLDDGLTRQIGNRLAFAHDVIEDYALAKVIEHPGLGRPLFEDAASTRRLFRPLRICAAKMLEADNSATKWESLLGYCRRLPDGDLWARECLLGAADSDKAGSNLDAISDVLLRDGGRLLATLLAAIRGAFMRDNQHAIQTLGERGDSDPKLHAARYKLPQDDRFSHVLSFALDRMDGLGDDAKAEFVKTASMWAFRGRGRALKRRIAEHAVQCTDWLHAGERILGQDYGESNETKCLVAATILYSSDAAPDTAKKFLSGTPSIIRSEYFRRALVERGGWTFLCKFLPDVAVDVLSRTMLTDSADSGLRDAMGTHDGGWTDRPSPSGGPFYLLLLSHSDHGLELVHRLLNHATEHWRRAQEAGGPMHPPRRPMPQTVRLESGHIKVYGDEDAFTWCGRARLAPDLVASALMALEMWLNGQVERGREPVAALFERVLRPTTSAAVVGVCCAVALRHMDKSAEAMLPILADPAFWIMNEARQGADLWAGVVHIARAGLLDRMRAMAGRHGQAARLDAFVPRLLFASTDGARKKIQEALAAFPERVPTFFEGDLRDGETMRRRQLYCEMLSKLADRNNYTYMEPPENTIKIAFDSDRFATSGKKQAAQGNQSRKELSAFSMWSRDLVEKNKIGPQFTIKSALEYASHIAGGDFLQSMPAGVAAYAADGRAGLLAALLIHRWDEAVEAGAADACLRDFEAMAGAIDPTIREESPYPYGADRYVARALPYCYLRCGRGRGAKDAILKFADAHNPVVLACLMRGLCILWGREDKLALECIARAKQRFHGKMGQFGRPYTDWEGYAALPSAMRGAPATGGGAGSALGRVVDDMLGETIATFKKLENDRDSDGAYGSFRTTWCSEFFGALGSYTAARPALRDGILERILSHWVEAPPLLESFMRHTLFWGVVEHRGEALLATWKRLLPAVIKSKLLTGYRDEDARKSIMALLIFADPPTGSHCAKELDILDGFAAEISSWCAALAGRRDAADAIMSLLGSAPPALLLEHGIGWLWQVLRPAGRGAVTARTAGLLSQLLRRASTHDYKGDGLPNHSAKYEWLVDCVIPFNDPVAESLRGEGKNPYSGTGGSAGGGSDE